MEINEDTQIPLKSIGVIALIVFYATIVWLKANAAETRLDKLENYQLTVINDLALIKAQLGIKPETKEK